MTFVLFNFQAMTVCLITVVLSNLDVEKVNGNF